jgi:nucleoside-diphosphate-sugar epimerase
MNSSSSKPDSRVRSVLVTGATGFLGSMTIARILEDTDWDVVALVRGSDQQQADAKLAAALGTIYGAGEGAGVGPGDGQLARVRAVRGDVANDELIDSPADRRRIVAEVRAVLHCAAVIAFNLPSETFEEINHQGTRRVLELAREIAEVGQLERFVHVSTAFVGGHMQSVFHEHELFAGAAHRNSYEASKTRAEVLVHEAAQAGLPAAIARPSVIAGDSKSGWTSSWFGISMPLRLFSIGIVEMLPAASWALVDTVPVDWVADGLLALLRGGGGSQQCPTCHLVAGERAITITELVEMSARVLGGEPVKVVDPEVFWRDLFPVVKENNLPALRFMEAAEAYLPYFDVRVRFDAGHGPELVGSQPPALPEYFERLIAYAKRTRWGKRKMALVEARATFGPDAPRAASAV